MATPTDDHVELKLRGFYKQYKADYNAHLRPRRSFVFYQEHASNTLQGDTRLWIVMTDKNPGPAVLEVLKYKLAMIDEHLITASFRQILETDTRLTIKLSRDKALNYTRDWQS